MARVEQQVHQALALPAGRRVVPREDGQGERVVARHVVGVERGHAEQRDKLQFLLEHHPNVLVQDVRLDPLREDDGGVHGARLRDVVRPREHRDLPAAVAHELIQHRDERLDQRMVLGHKEQAHARRVLGAGPPQVVGVQLQVDVVAGVGVLGAEGLDHVLGHVVELERLPRLALERPDRQRVQQEPRRLVRHDAGAHVAPMLDQHGLPVWTRLLHGRRDRAHVARMLAEEPGVVPALPGQPQGRHVRRRDGPQLAGEELEDGDKRVDEPFVPAKHAREHSPDAGHVDWPAVRRLHGEQRDGHVRVALAEQEQHLVPALVQRVAEHARPVHVSGQAQERNLRKEHDRALPVRGVEHVPVRREHLYRAIDHLHALLVGAQALVDGFRQLAPAQKVLDVRRIVAPIVGRDADGVLVPRKTAELEEAELEVVLCGQDIRAAVSRVSKSETS